jgi:hypothetical protein
MVERVDEREDAGCKRGLVFTLSNADEAALGEKATPALVHLDGDEQDAEASPLTPPPLASGGSRGRMCLGFRAWWLGIRLAGRRRELPRPFRFYCHVS